MTNFEIVHDFIKDYMQHCEKVVKLESNLHDTSKDDHDKSIPPEYVYEGDADLTVIDLDRFAQIPYKKSKGVKTVVNSADAFLVNADNEWFFIEFKNSELEKGDKKQRAELRNNIIKKAYSSWYMHMDMLYTMNELGKPLALFDYDNPIKFAKEHVHYVLVVPAKKNPAEYKKVHELKMAKKLPFTPNFMDRLEDYIFKSACMYTEGYFETEFVKKFSS